jgi:hypothetical protein
MSEIINSFSTYLKNHPGANTIVSFLLGGLLGNVLSNWVYQEFGYLTAIVSTVVLIAFVLLVIFLAIHITPRYKDRKREQLKNIIFEPLGDRYKGLIVSISRLNDAKEEIINKIDSIKDINNLEDLNKLFELRGVGQTFRAIIHHRKELEVCWLLYTEGSVEGKEVVEHFIKKFGLSLINTIPIFIEDPYNIKSIHKSINGIYVKGLEEANLHETDVIADITGGTTPMSSAIILACTSSDRNIEYVEQNTNALIKVEHI